MKPTRLLPLLLFTLLPLSASAQSETEPDEDLNASAEVSLVSHYMWRGQDKGGISIQPAASLNWKALYVQLAGNAGFDKADAQEVNVTLGLKKWGLNIGVTDYWETGVDPEDRYFYFDEKNTAHQLEGNIGYSCKYFGLQAYAMFWGNDFKINGDRAYSTYVELSIPFRLAGLDWDLRAGVTPMESAGYKSTAVVQGVLGNVTVTQNNYFYGEGFTCNMASLRATKTLHYKHVKVPVFAEFHTNPYLQKATLLAGVSIVAF